MRCFVEGRSRGRIGIGEGKKYNEFKALKKNNCGESLIEAREAEKSDGDEDARKEGSSINEKQCKVLPAQLGTEGLGFSLDVRGGLRATVGMVGRSKRCSIRSRGNVGKGNFTLYSMITLMKRFWICRVFVDARSSRTRTFARNNVTMTTANGSKAARSTRSHQNCAQQILANEL